MAEWRRVLTALPGDPSSVPSTYTSCSQTTCHASSRGSNDLSWPPQAPHSFGIHIQIHKQNSKSFSNKKNYGDNQKQSALPEPLLTSQILYHKSKSKGLGGCHWDPVVKHSSSGKERSRDWQCLNSPTSWLLLCHMNYVQERTIAGVSDNPGQNNGFSVGQRGSMALSHTRQMLPRRGRPGDAHGAIPTPAWKTVFKYILNFQLPDDSSIPTNGRLLNYKWETEETNPSQKSKSVPVIT